MKRDDEMGKLRSTFDRSLNTISGDARNLQTILDKSLHKLDKHILATKGIAVTDSEMTSTDEYHSPSKAPPKRLNIVTKLDKYELPVDNEEKTPKSSKSQDGKTDSHKKGKNSSLTSKSRLSEYTPPRAKVSNAMQTSAVKRPLRPDRR